MPSSIPVGFLTTRSHPLLPYLLDRFRADAPEIQPVLLLDEKDFSEKDQRIFEQRTQGAFPSRGTSFVEEHAHEVVPNHNAEECQRAIRAHGIDLLINAGTPRLVGRDLLLATRGVVNVHPGILPKYRGASCPEWAVYHDDPVGVTAHFMDERLDAGPVLFTRELQVTKRDTYMDMRIALYRLAHATMVNAVQDVLARGLRASSLPAQEDAPVFKPIPNDLLAIAMEKLATGAYRHAR